MNDDDDAATALRELAATLGLQPAGPPAVDELVPRDDVDEAWLDAALGRVLDDVGATGQATGRDDTVSAPTPLRSPERRRRRVPSARWLAAAAAVPLLVGVFFALPSQPVVASPPVLVFSDVGGVDDLTPDAGTPAGPVLERIASTMAADDAGDADVPAGRDVQHVVTNQWRLEVADGVMTVRPTANESWLLPDGRTRLRETELGAHFEPDGRMVTAAGERTVVRDETRSRYWAPDHAAALPRDPAALARDWITVVPDRDQATPAAVQVVGWIDTLHATFVMPADLTAAAWRVLADQDGVRYLGSTRDRAGRPGSAVSVWDPHQRTLTVLVIDPGSGRLLERDDILIEDGGEPTTVSFTTFLRSEWVTSHDVP